ncbi:NeuD/PglB/VioB family sugar acetyltransferase [Halodesulfovibrio aestuarii]|uniref:NeuD/PglB/VioB family sugar acetyltransferase n=1 Tax=Halodesulfovibrio aestuarii TaxID=126333 RepID=UPI003D3273CD
MLGVGKIERLDLPDPLVILGFGGHARSVADVALDLGVQHLVFVDENARKGETFHNFQVVRSLSGDWESGAFMLAIGDNVKRRLAFDVLVSGNKSIYTLASKNAYVGIGAEICSGTFVAHGAYIGPEVKVGHGCILNTACVIEHECSVGNFCHISVNATLAGRCRIGNNVMIGAGATIIDGVRIASNVVVGAGAVVVNDIDDPGTYVGVPTHKIY